MEQRTIYIALGGNVGNTEQVFDEALAILSQKINIEARSERMVTEAMYNTEQEDFLNMVFCGNTGQEAEELLEWFKDIEGRFGRDLSAPRFSPRILDIDLLYFGTEIIDTETLKIPHPSIAERRFVLEPLSQVAKLDFHDPVTGKSVISMMRELLAK